MNNKFNYDTYCGLYCGACSILLAQKTGFEDKFAAFWQVKNSQTECKGCKSDSVFANCEKCQIRTCARERKIEHCALDCSDFPCTIWNEGNGQPKDIIEKLPHLKIIPKNLMRIKQVGVNQWLTEQENLWKCPDCQANFAWYTPNCPNCGKDLEKFKDYNTI